MAGVTTTVLGLTEVDGIVGVDGSLIPDPWIAVY